MTSPRDRKIGMLTFRALVLACLVPAGLAEGFFSRGVIDAEGKTQLRFEAAEEPEEAAPA